MEQRVRILLADGNEDFRFLLRRRLEQSPWLTVTAETGNLRTAARLLRQLRPEVLLLDPVSAGPRGVDFLEHIRQLDPTGRTSLVILPSVCGEPLLRLCRRLGVSMVLPKPLDAEVLVEHLESYARSPARPALLREAEDQRLRARVEMLLLELRMKPSHLGFRMTRDVLEALREQEYVCGLTKVLYQDVAERYETTRSCVERNIRNAVSGAWSKMTDEQKQHYFKYAEEKAPGNAAFLETLAGWLRRNEEELI